MGLGSGSVYHLDFGQSSTCLSILIYKMWKRIPVPHVVCGNSRVNLLPAQLLSQYRHLVLSTRIFWILIFVTTGLVQTSIILFLDHRSSFLTGLSPPVVHYCGPVSPLQSKYKSDHVTILQPLPIVLSIKVRSLRLCWPSPAFLASAELLLVLRAAASLAFFHLSMLLPPIWVECSSCVFTSLDLSHP